MRKILPLLLLVLAACQREKLPPPSNLPPVAFKYFPPVNEPWARLRPESLGWNTDAINELYTYLQSKNTKAFIILKDGKLVVEKYFGSFTADSNWYWASAGKTATALLTGIAREEGFLSIDHPVSQYLGNGWTSLTPVQESGITIYHQLTMTTGLDDGVADPDCTTPACLKFKIDPGTRWAYHNAPYTLLGNVIEAATGKNFATYFNQKIRDRIGMNGTWAFSGSNRVYYSTARSAARFGWLMLNKGYWDGASIIHDSSFVNDQVGVSKNFEPNRAYGYLTWINKSTTHMRPGSQLQFGGRLISYAPADMFAALGKNDQKIYVVPSQNLVIVRFGNSAGNNNLAISSFDDELWGKLQNVF